jgi:hypothetical protein
MRRSSSSYLAGARRDRICQVSTLARAGGVSQDGTFVRGFRALTAEQKRTG